ncbi:MAG: pmtX4 [Hyphomicrobiales bacterium]|nr:pmtX4 [Hyphomicrobiales bacterium]
MSNYLASFFLSWLSNPLRVAAIAPSGNALAELITSDISNRSGPIIELGPGTGVFTQKLLQKGIRQEDITLVEYGSDFVRILQLRFPSARVLWMDAATLPSVSIAKEGSVGAVISGLPLLSMPSRKVRAILTGAFRYLNADGAFYQFTYGRKCPVSRPLLDHLGLTATLMDRTLRNIPPASVYRITRSPILDLTANPTAREETPELV